MAPHLLLACALAAAALAGCVEGVIEAKPLSAAAEQRCRDIKARRGQIRVGMRLEDVRRALGPPDSQEAGLNGVTHVVYNAHCELLTDQLRLMARQGVVISVYPDPEPAP